MATTYPSGQGSLWRRLSAGLLVLGVTFASSSALQAQPVDYPNRPIKLVVGFPPGGGVDVIARIFADKLAVLLKQPVYVENRPGASGSIAGRQVATAEPDGYTVMVNSNSIVINQVLNPNTGLDIERDLVAVVSVAPQPNLIAAAPDLPVKSLSELIALARAKKLLFGSPGLGSIPHLVVEYLFTSLSELRLDHVPYPGAAQALTAVMTSQIELASVTMPPAVQLVQAGKVKPIVITSAKRAAALPDVPTVAESGYPGFEIVTWTGFFMPANTPKPIIERFEKAALEVANMPEIRDRLVTLGFDTASTSGERFRSDIAAELKRWTEVVQKAKIKMQ
jgi:tripartite-type tricarboxylate transporter receptor subunit TctC